MFSSKSRVFTGVIWSSIQRFGTMIISFVSNIVLARLLLPSDFGIIGMLVLFIAIANIFVDSGLGSALIQKKEPSHKDYSTVFWANLAISLFFYILLYACAPYISRFYKMPILCSVLRIEGIVLFLNSFCLIQTTILRKELDFKKLSIANIVGNIIGTIVGVILAYWGYGVWSLVVRMLVVSLVTVFMLWGISKWRPSFTFSLGSFKELFDFGGFILLSSIVTSISNNIQTLIIGKLFSPGVLGTYTQAKQLRDIPSMSISSIISQVLYPFFSNNQENNHKIGRTLNFSIYITAYITSAIVAILILVSKPLIIILYTDRWIGAVGMFQILCVGGLFLAVQDINYYAVAAKGKSRTLFLFNLIQVGFGIILMLFGGKWFGIQGLLFAMVISVFCFYCVYAALAAHYSKSSIFVQLKNILLCMSLTVMSGFVTYYICRLFEINNLMTVIASLLIFCCIHAMLSFLFRIKPFMYIIKSIM